MSITNLPIQGVDLDAIFRDHAKHTAAILAIEAAMGDCPLSITINETADRHQRDSWSIELAQRFVDRKAWSEVVQCGPVWTVMDATARQEWHDNYYAMRLPPFTRENVESSVRGWLDGRGDMMKRGVAELFRKLSSSHVTNRANGFGRKMIVKHIGQLWRSGFKPSPNYDRCNTLDDLNRVLHKLRGLPEPDTRGRAGAYQIVSEGYAGDMVARFPFFEVKLFLNGNGHLHLLHEPDVLRLNKVLSMATGGAALPAPPKKARA